MQVLFLTKYGFEGASSRYRTFQYLPYLERHNIYSTVEPLFDGKYLERLYQQGKRSWFKPAVRYMSRIRALARPNKYDVIVIEKELFPFVPKIFERHWLPKTKPMVLDYDDAIFHRYDDSKNRLIRGMLGKKIRGIIRESDCVTVGNDYLKDYAERSGARRTEIIPTVIDLNRYPKFTTSNRRRGSDDAFIIGWIGSPTTSKYLELIEAPLQLFGDEIPVRLLAIGSGSLDHLNVPAEVRKWSFDRELQDLRDMDVGIMPLFDTKWERGKCGFKLIQYMAAGLPVVASPVGVNRELVQDGFNGFLVHNEHEWAEALCLLRDDPKLAYEMGRNGRNLVEGVYNLQKQAPRMAAILNEVVERGSK